MRKSLRTLIRHIEAGNLKASLMNSHKASVSVGYIPTWLCFYFYTVHQVKVLNANYFILL